MDIQLRLRTLRVIERIQLVPSYAEQLGLADASTFRGIPIPPPPKETENKGGHFHGTN